MPPRPRPRGPLSAHVLGFLGRPPHEVAPGPGPTGDPLADDDLHLALYVLYELHYRGFAGVDDAWEWEPSLLAERARLERRFEDALAAEVVVPAPEPGPHAVEDALRAMIADDDGPPLSRWVETRATLEQVRELMVHRSPYQLKEADPHTFGIPRITGAPKSAMVEIQADEYGGGRPDWMHSELFAQAMGEVGLDARYGAYLDLVPGVSLAAVNLMSLLGLHRRRRGAIVGHLAAFEMTSCAPNRRYANGLRRLGRGPAATAFYDEHVEADAVHDVLAAHDLAQGLADDEPDLAADILFGAAALLALDARGARYVLERWERGATSLLAPLPGAPRAPAPAGAAV
jgi:Iron-containing redox enzyme